MTSNINREQILDLLHEVARDAIDHYEIPRSYDPVDYEGVADQLIALLTPVPDPNGDAVAWRQQVADGLGYMIPETGEIADAETVLTAAKGWQQDSRDYEELQLRQQQPELVSPPF